ncbi:hypothetical protein K3888_13190 [Dietzia aurantiaca]|uniref:hypothetical protein n=1 Tax=Dietzia aurantiaca TaxID=983873 RepID=UPI001E4D41E3|nr:hypothetical protein [Dietzia aurantiaca]MCD2263654.1 hypothetical protein [Dietzia aurantiaca]
MTSDETIRKVARVLFLSDRGDTLPVGFAERQWDEGYAVRDDYIRRARALADEGLLAPAPLREEWAFRYVRSTGQLVHWECETEADARGSAVNDGDQVVHRYVTDWETP